ncbi:MAG: hypothetical protein GY842_05340 [bacterium]|nr:hypothetical protein [bacterium]
MAARFRNKPDPHQLSLFEHKLPQLLNVEEIFARASQLLLENLAEDRRFERKSARIHAPALADWIVMFANTPPEGGIIVVGVEDDGRFTGCGQLSQAHLNRLERCGDIHCPDVRYDTKLVPVTTKEGREEFVLAMRVEYRSDRLVENTKGEAYIRRGDSKNRLSDEEKQELRIARGQVEIELESCPQYVFPDDFDLSLVKEFTSRFLASRDLDAERITTEEVLELRHLGQREGGKFVANLAGVLLFAKDPLRRVPGCKIRVLRFDGEHEGTGEKFNAVKDAWIEGCVPSLLSQAELVVESQLREFSRLDRDGKFYTAPEYPKAAWYEALVNACVHRSYGLRNMNIFVRIFDDRVEVESPGGFPGIVSPENIYETHDPRNPFLMDAMFYLQFVKCAREGTRRMRDTMNELRLPEPEFSERRISHDLVRVTLRNNIKQRKVWIDAEASALVGEAIFESLDEHARRAINFVAENGTINVSQVQRLTGRSWDSAKKLLLGLVQQGILDHQLRKDLERDPKAHFTLRRNGIGRSNGS